VTVQHISVLESHVDSKSKKTVKSHKRARTIFRLPPHSPSINPIQQHGQMPGDTPPDSRYAAQVTFLSENPKILKKSWKSAKTTRTSTKQSATPSSINRINARTDGRAVMALASGLSSYLLVEQSAWVRIPLCSLYLLLFCWGRRPCPNRDGEGQSQMDSNQFGLSQALYITISSTTGQSMLSVVLTEWRP
jgi:hypothetical protein